MILHAKLAKDCFVVGRFPLSVLLLMNEARYPWFILVPQRENISEIQQLCARERHQLMDESCMLSEALRAAFSPQRVNVAAIGNIVNQLHIHHIARFNSDAAWPAPVWGKFPCEPYSVPVREAIVGRLLNQLALAGHELSSL